MATMSLIHRRPSHPLFALREAERAFDQLHRRMLPPSFARSLAIPQRFIPSVEAVETEDAYEVAAELPGVAREDLEVFVQEGILTIKGVRRRKSRQAPEVIEAKGDEADAEAKADESLDAGSKFERRIRFNEEIDEAGVTAKYVDGVLELTIPKQVQVEPEIRTIPVEVA